MNEPAYKPSTWILFQQGDGGGFGQVIGGNYDGETWVYTVSGSLQGGELRGVRQEEVTFLLDNGTWLAPTNFSGENSAYAAPSR